MLFVQKKLACSAQILFEKPLKIVCLHAQKVQNVTYLVTKIHHVISDYITVKKCGISNTFLTQMTYII